MDHLDTRAPMELFGTRPGVSVIDPSSVLTRLWYFDGKFLRAEGFRLDQEYVRSLVALANQALGHGVVHGFDVAQSGGDSFRIEGGLALAPSGRVVHLPQRIDVSVAKLIARSTGEFEPGTPSRSSSADFSRCPPERPGEPVTGVSPRPLYVLTVAPAEALCGEEERFGQLCEDACATETDRSVAVEGVRFRVRELRLTLPTSQRVPFSQAHLRSRAASAFFADERRATPSMLSGAGLRGDVWCGGAEGAGGDEVPLAVFERSASTTTWLDMWTARRELMEQTPQRYWSRRCAMRPLDVFLAQVLQFQCQLLSLGSDGGRPSGGDACVEERAALADVDDVLSSLARNGSSEERRIPEEVGTRAVESVHVRSLEEALAGEGRSGMAQRLAELRARVAGALRGRGRPDSGSLLVDGGIIELPSGGYLPIDATGSVQAQVQALMGPGVDLRFCAVRPDFIPEALQEAQHMERISLTQGIDDPAAVEEVDVLVPGGEIARRDTSIEAFEGRVRLLPASQPQLHAASRHGSALTLSAVARDQVQDGWSWTLAAHGEAPHRLAVGNLFDAVAAQFGGAQREAAADDRVEIHVEEQAEHERLLNDPAFGQRMSREHVLARERFERAGGVMVERNVENVPSDRPIPSDQKRPFSLWFDVEVDRDLRELDIGGRVPARLRVSVYSRAATEPLLVDAQVSGTLVVTSKQSRTSGGGSRIFDIVTDLNGTVDPFVLNGDVVRDQPPQPLRGLTLRWRVGVSGRGVRILGVGVEQAEVRLRARFEDTGDPRRVHGVLHLLGQGDRVVDTGDWRPVTVDERQAGEGMRFADVELTTSPGALDVGSSGRELGEAVIEVIGTELALRGRDGSFTPFARRRLLEAEPSDTGAVTTSADWVMFHRRRTKVCGGPAPRPQATRRFRWFHAVVLERAELERFRALAGRWEQMDDAADDLEAVRIRERVDHLGFEPVTTVEFPEQSAELRSSRVAVRSAWRAGERGDVVLAGTVAAPVTGDGANVDLSRLMAVTSLISDLVDTSQMQTQVLRHVPPEFQATGIDGVLFTVGFRRPESELAHVLLVRTSRKQWQELDAAREMGEVTPELFTSVMGEAPDTFVASLNDDALVNRDDVVSWWGPRDSLRFAGRVPSADVADRGDAGTRVAQWTDAIDEALRLPRVVDLDPLVWTVDDNDMGVFLVRGDEPIG